MNYISGQEFLKQSEKVRLNLLEWWKPCIGDLFCDIDAYDNNHVGCVLDNDKIECMESDKEYYYYIPLLQIHQLLKFIEDRIGGKVDLAYYCDKSFKKTIVNYNNEFNGYTIQVIDKDLRILKEFNGLGYDLLQALWKAVIEIAECK